MPDIDRLTNTTANKGWSRFFRLSLTLIWLLTLSAACSQSPQTRQPPLATADITPRNSSSATATSSATRPAATRTPTVTRTLLPPTLSTEEAGQIEASLTLDAYIQTHLATLEMPTATSTPCPESGCTTPTFTRTPYLSPTPTLTFTPTFPMAYLEITQPGPLSKVVSPIHLRTFVHTPPGGIVRIELIGEDGRLIYRQVYRGNASELAYYDFNMNIDYEIPGTAEAARLQVSVDDSYKRPVAESSVDLVLLTMGDEDINPGTDGVESIVIRQPTGRQTISGGVLHVEGFVRPLNNNPFLAQLYTQEGSLVGERQFTTPNLPLGEYRPFTVDIPYTVSQLRSTRLIISQQGDHIPGVAILTSMLVLLEP